MGELSSGVQGLMNALGGSCIPIHNLRVGCCYRYNGTGDLFSKPFVFRVIEDRFDDYLICINETFETSLEKSFEFIDAVNDGIIEYLGIPEDIGIEIIDKEEHE